MPADAMIRLGDTYINFNHVILAEDDSEGKRRPEPSLTLTFVAPDYDDAGPYQVSFYGAERYALLKYMSVLYFNITGLMSQAEEQKEPSTSDPT